MYRAAWLALRLWSVLPVALGSVAGCTAGAGADLRLGPPAEAAPAVPGGPTVGNGRTVHYDSASFQRTRDGRVQVVLFRPIQTLAAPDAAGRTARNVGGDAFDRAFEFVLLDLPERPRYGWVRQDRINGWRWVRGRGPEGEPIDGLWHADIGCHTMRFSLDGSVLHVEFRATFVPVGTAAETEGERVLAGKVRLAENVLRTQGLLNVYGRAIEKLDDRIAWEARGPK